jgi:hypothetical protein
MVCGGMSRSSLTPDRPVKERWRYAIEGESRARPDDDTIVAGPANYLVF